MARAHAPWTHPPLATGTLRISRVSCILATRIYATRRRYAGCRTGRLARPRARVYARGGDVSEEVCARKTRHPRCGKESSRFLLALGLPGALRLKLNRGKPPTALAVTLPAFLTAASPRRRVVPPRRRFARAQRILYVSLRSK